MSKKAIIILLTIVVVLAATVVLRISMGDSKTDQRRQNVPLVKVEKPQRETITYTLNFTGDVLAGQQANIYSKVGGTLERVLVDMGEYVRQGQLLAMIDTTELSQQYLQASATYQNASINYKRTKELSEQNLVSK
jgi:multidrug efflux pump subunit AcrA (membrane-fusion protein)